MKKTVPATHYEYLKYMFEDISSLPDLVQHLRGMADYYEDLAKQDAKLTQPIDSGHVLFMVPGHDVEFDTDDFDVDCPEGDMYPEDDYCPKCYSKG